LLLLLCVLVTAHRAPGAADLSNATLVVYNPNFSESKSLALYYAAKRGLPKDRLIALPCSNDEEIDRHEYDHAIAGPLRRHFQEAQLWTVEQMDEQRVIANQVRYIVLIRGIPLKIRFQVDIRSVGRGSAPAVFGVAPVPGTYTATEAPLNF
jgi:uncharacterized protein (TIGR03790 family)